MSMSPAKIEPQALLALAYTFVFIIYPFTLHGEVLPASAVQLPGPRVVSPILGRQQAQPGTTVSEAD